MTKVSELYIEGYAKPLGQWTDSALAQLRADIGAVLGSNPSRRAKLELYETYCVIEAEQERRAREPVAIEAPQKRPLLSLFKRAPQPETSRASAAPEREASELQRSDTPERLNEAEPRNGGLEP
jgi:hypothetical protein